MSRTLRQSRLVIRCLTVAMAVQAASSDAGDPVEVKRPDRTADTKHYEELGVEYLKAGDWKEAIAAFDEALRINPRDSQAYIYRGAACLAGGEPNAAISNFTQLIVLEPTNAIAYLDRSAAYRAKEQFNRALEDLEKSIRLNPTNGTALKTRASLCIN